MKLVALGLENFRLFTNEFFEFKPLTILIGANSSGKSTIAKALNLLQKNLIAPNRLGKLRFYDEVHGLGRFENVLSHQRKAEAKEITFHLKFQNTSFKKDKTNKKQTTHLLNEIDFITFSYTYEQDIIHPENGNLIRLQIAVEKATQKDILINTYSNQKGDFIFDYNLKWFCTKILKENLFTYKPNLYEIWDKVDSSILEQEKERRKAIEEGNRKTKLEQLEEYLLIDPSTKDNYQEYKTKLVEIDQHLDTIDNPIDLSSFRIQESQLIKSLKAQKHQLELAKKNIETKETKLREQLERPNNPDKEDLEQLTSVNDEWNRLESKLDAVQQQINALEEEAAEQQYLENQLPLHQKRTKLHQLREGICDAISIIKNEAKKSINEIYDDNIKKIKDGIIRSELYEQLTIGSKKFLETIANQAIETIAPDRKNKQTIAEYLYSKEWENLISAIINPDLNDLKATNIIEWTEGIEFIKKIDKINDINFKDIIGKESENQFVLLLVDQIYEIIKLAFQPIPFEFLSAKRGFQQRIYQSGNSAYHLDNSLAKVLGFQTSEQDFIQKWMKEFNICQEDELFEVEVIEGHFVQGYIVKKDNSKINIADKGLGIIQLIPIIIEIAAALGKDQLLIIEEPGTFLHPDLQAKLVDLITSAIPQKVQFLIETHSEYFVRKLQYTVAQKNYSFPHDDIVLFNMIDGGIKKDIKLGLEGDLSEEFEEGFYNLSVELEQKRRWELEASKNNIEAYLKKGNKIVFCEGNNVEQFNQLGIKNFRFLPAHNKDDIFLKLKKHPDCYGLMDRDYITDSECKKIKAVQPRLFSLDLYCFENYLYHPDNITCLGLKDFDIESYKKDILESNKKSFVKTLLNISKSRQSYYVLGERIIKSKKSKECESIGTALNSDEFDKVYPYFNIKAKDKDIGNLKDYIHNQIKKLPEYKNNEKPQNILSQMPWFKQQIEKILESIIKPPINA